MTGGWFAGFAYKPLGSFHNYHVTPERWAWPVPSSPGNKSVDGFSPNLNKYLHAGHLKNLAVAAAISNIACDGNSVAMLGASLGKKDGAQEQYLSWCELARYSPVVYFDVELPAPQVALADGEGEYAGCKMLGDVVVYKSDGRPTYAAHDLAFAQEVAPDYYLTGAEQKAHFKSLGLGNKHLALGLVLGSDGKKMKSTVKREGEEANMMSADELLAQVVDCLRETSDPTKLAWNILAWQFNSSEVGANTKFCLDQWAKADSPGLYVTYTYARMVSALSKTARADAGTMSASDAELCGFADYFHYYFAKAQKKVQPCHVAHFALALAKRLAGAYAESSIKDGTPGFVYAVSYATDTLGKCMDALAMYRLHGV